MKFSRLLQEILVGLTNKDVCEQCAIYSNFKKGKANSPNFFFFQFQPKIHISFESGLQILTFLTTIPEFPFLCSPTGTLSQSKTGMFPPKWQQETRSIQLKPLDHIKYQTQIINAIRKHLEMNILEILN